jgi:hypothetical protein
MTTAKNGLSAKTLQRTLGTSYRTAWKMLHRYRIAMVRSEREQLSGIIEVDESLVGGVDHGGKRGRGADKAIVVIAVEIEEPMGFGRVRMRHIPDASGDKLVPFVCDVVTPGLLYKQTVGAATMVCNRMVMCAKRRYFHPTMTLHTFLCRAFTVSRVCSNGGFSVHTRGQRRTFAILPRGIYFPIQPSHIT